jgi:hypothetical protein
MPHVPTSSDWPVYGVGGSIKDELDVVADVKNVVDGAELVAADVPFEPSFEEDGNTTIAGVLTEVTLTAVTAEEE